MRRLLPVSAIIGLAIGLSGQSSPPSPNKLEESPSAPCTVVGRILNAVDGSPLKSARAALVEQAESLHMYGSMSDSDGHFIFKDVAPGRYEFFAFHTGFVTQHYQSDGADGGALLALKAGQKIADVLFRLTLAAVVTGRVNDQQGEPMIGVRVTALDWPSDEEMEDRGPYGTHEPELVAVSSAQTDDRGQYRIFGLKAGQYYIRATDSLEPPPGGDVDQESSVRLALGTDYAPLYYPGTPQLDQAQTVSLRAGEQAQADFSMRRLKTVAVAGRLIGPNGGPKNGLVSLEQPGADGYTHDTTTDEKGNFSMKGIPPGSYTIIADGRGEGGKTYQARQKLEVGSDNIDSLTIALGAGTSFRGRVSVAGPGTVAFDRLVVLFFLIDGGEAVALARVKKDATFEITSVQDGTYAVIVRGLERGWYAKSARIGQNDVLEKGLQVEKDASGGMLEIALGSESAQLEGSVSDHDRAVAGARVRVAPEPETPYNRHRSQIVKTDQAGHFAVIGLAPGKYQVAARGPSSAEGTVPKSDARTVTLSRDDHQSIQLTILRPETE